MHIPRWSSGGRGRQKSAIDVLALKLRHNCILSAWTEIIEIWWLTYWFSLLWRKGFSYTGDFVSPRKFFHFKFLKSSCFFPLFGCWYYEINILKYSYVGYYQTGFSFFAVKDTLGSKTSSRRTNPFWGKQACGPQTVTQPDVPQKSDDLLRKLGREGLVLGGWYWEVEVRDRTE